MKKLIALFTVLSFTLAAIGQNDTTRYTMVNGYGFTYNRLKAKAALVMPADTVQNKLPGSLVVLNDSLYVRTGVKWEKIGANAAVDTVIMSTRAWRQKGDDSVSALVALRVRISDTASMLLPYLRKSDTSAMLFPYFRKGDTVTLSNRINTKLNISDTAAMLAPYAKAVAGLPIGGTTGQILAKNSATNYDVAWIDNYTTDVRETVKATESINKGQAVYVTGADGTNVLVSKASNTSDATSSKTLGLLFQNLATNDQGFVIIQGRLSGLNTIGANAGDPVWLGTNGNLLYGTANKPVAPAHMVYIGVVTRVNSNNGEIFVNVQNGFELEELHDVLITDSVNNQVIAYDSTTRLWKNKTIAQALGYTPANNATTVKYTDTASMLTPYYRKADTVTLSNRINLKVNISDTASMLTPYLRRSDTTAMLTPYLRKADTLALSNRINLKVNISDTASMLTPYIRAAGYGLTKSGQSLLVDTAAIATRARVQKAVDSLGSGKTNGSGTVNYVSKWTGTSTLGDSQIFDNGTNVGVGTSSPSVKFDVTGSGRFGVPNTTDGNITLTSQNNGIGYGASLLWNMATAGGNSNSITAQIRPTIYQPADGYLNTLDFYVGDWNNNANVGTAKMRLYQNGRLYVTGNVGIGTATPANPLDVNGFIRSFGTATADLRSVSDSSSAILQVNNHWPRIILNDARVGGRRFDLGSFPSTTSGNFSIYDNTASTVRMQINSTGNIGINTTTDAGYRLDVNGTLRTVNGANFATTSGNVGVGTASPSSKLHIIGTGASTNSINVGLIVDMEATAAEQVGAGTAIRFRGKSGGGDIANYDQAQIATNNTGSNNTHGLSFYYKPNASSPLTEAMTIYGNGYAGFGNTTPAYPIDVAGIATTAGNNSAAGSSTRFRNIYTRSRANSAGISGDVYADQLFHVSGGSAFEIYNADANFPLVFGTGATERMRIDGVGNVGVGGNPLDRMTIIQDQDASTNFRVRNSTNGANSYVMMGVNASGNSWGMRMGSTAANSNALDIVSDAFGTPVSRMRFFTNGRIGVNTTSDAGYQFDVNGTFNVRSNYGYFGGDANTSVYLGSFSNEGRIGVGGRSSFPTAALTLYTADGTNNFERMRITSGGDVGIGIQSPLWSTSNRRVLEVNGTSQSLIGLNVNGATGGYIWQNGNDMTIAANNKGYVQFGTNGQANRMRIDTIGRVGIGFSDPAYTLDINGQFRAFARFTGGFTGDGLYGSNAIMPVVQMPNGETLRFGYASAGDGNYWGRIGTLNGVHKVSFGAAAPSVFTINTGFSNTERLRVDSNGNVGIGTQSPGSRFQINGTGGQVIRLMSTSTTNQTNAIESYFQTGGGWSDLQLRSREILFHSGTSGSYAGKVSVNGNFLINTSTDASYRLDVNGNTRVTGKIDVTASESIGHNIVRSGTSDIAAQIYSSNAWLLYGAESSAGGSIFTGSTQYAAVVGSGYNRPLQFGTNSVIRMEIDSTGLVGINTTSPTERLDVNGKARIRTVDSTASAMNMLYVDATGVVKKAPVPGSSIEYYTDVNTIASGWTFVKDSVRNLNHNFINVIKDVNTNEATATMQIAVYRSTSTFTTGAWQTVATVPASYAPKTLVYYELPGYVGGETFYTSSSVRFTGASEYSGAKVVRIDPSGNVEVRIGTVNGSVASGGTNYVVIPIAVTWTVYNIPL